MHAYVSRDDVNHRIGTQKEYSETLGESQGKNAQPNLSSWLRRIITK